MFSKVVILGNPLLYPQLAEFNIENVCLLLDEEFKLEELETYIMNKKDNFPPDTLWLGFIGVHYITSRKGMISAINYEPAMKMLYVHESIATNVATNNNFKKEILLITNSIRNKLNSKSGFVIMPPLPIGIIPTNQGHTHNDFYYTPDCYHVMHNELEQIITLYSKFCVCITNSLKDNVTGHHSSMVHFFQTYACDNVNKVSEKCGSSFVVYKEQISQFIAASLRITSSSNNAKNYAEQIPASLPICLGIESRNHFYDQIIFIGNRTVVNVIKRFEESYMYIGLDDIFNWEHLMQQLAPLKETAKQYILVLIFDMSMLFPLHTVADCTKRRCPEPAKFCKIGSRSRSQKITEQKIVQSAIDNVKRIEQSVVEYFEGNSKVIIAPLVPRVIVKLDQMPSNEHERLHDNVIWPLYINGPQWSFWEKCLLWLYNMWQQTFWDSFFSCDKDIFLKTEPFLGSWKGKSHIALFESTWQMYMKKLSFIRAYLSKKPSDVSLQCSATGTKSELKEEFTNKEDLKTHIRQGISKRPIEFNAKNVYSETNESLNVGEDLNVKFVFIGNPIFLQRIRDWSNQAPYYYIPVDVSHLYRLKDALISLKCNMQKYVFIFLADASILDNGDSVCHGKCSDEPCISISDTSRTLINGVIEAIFDIIKYLKGYFETMPQFLVAPLIPRFLIQISSEDPYKILSKVKGNLHKHFSLCYHGCKSTFTELIKELERNWKQNFEASKYYIHIPREDLDMALFFNEYQGNRHLLLFKRRGRDFLEKIVSITTAESNRLDSTMKSEENIGVNRSSAYEVLQSTSGLSISPIEIQNDQTKKGAISHSERNNISSRANSATDKSRWAAPSEQMSTRGAKRHKSRVIRVLQSSKLSDEYSNKRQRTDHFPEKNSSVDQKQIYPVQASYPFTSRAPSDSFNNNWGGRGDTPEQYGGFQGDSHFRGSQGGSHFRGSQGGSQQFRGYEDDSQQFRGYGDDSQQFGGYGGNSQQFGGYPAGSQQQSVGYHAGSQQQSVGYAGSQQQSVGYRAGSQQQSEGHPGGSYKQFGGYPDGSQQQYGGYPSGSQQQPGGHPDGSQQQFRWY